MFKKEHKKLQEWYKENGRHELPWRKVDSAYPIWVSEIMLQQTQVKTVLERFYFPFLKRFPTLQDLAQANEDEVLKMWEGLGYYTRARNLHKTAQICQEELPQSVNELVALPGIGQSTAHAIAAFAYHTAVPILDANVKRILYRVFGVKMAKDRELWSMAYKLFDKKHPYNYNQALMDIGATICQAKAVACKGCPFQDVCKAYLDDPLLYPQKKAKKVVPKRIRHIVIHEKEGKVALRQRTSRLLNGLWGFMEHETEQEHTVIGEVIHKYTHFHLHATVYHTSKNIDDVTWFSKDTLKELALSGADHKCLSLLQESEV